ncbi:MAG: hypothetical protein PUK75_09835 [bacterium]|nr:hypothetical protein [bacterium]MDY4100659.1 hypothetical protein [Lachnospiraceae bacterium]
MKKRLLYGAVIIVICLVSIFVYRSFFVPTGNTIESREKILNDSISKGKEWSIAKEIKIEDYIISAACSTDHKASLAVFQPTVNGGYKFLTFTTRNEDEIIIGGAAINGSWYDLVWFNGAQTEYAEIIYTIDGKKQDTLKYDTTDMDIICKNNLEKEYTINVTYYDKNGNKYE